MTAKPHAPRDKGSGLLRRLFSRLIFLLALVTGALGLYAQEGERPG
jgi:hypothetical protein